MRAQLAILSAPMLGVLAGCVTGGTPVSAALPAKAMVSFDGADYQVLSGADLILSRVQVPMSDDEGLTAKRVAEAHCASVKRPLDPVSLGRYQVGSWIFPRGCA